MTGRSISEECEQHLCTLVQVESMAGMQQLAAIAAVDGVDGVFFGPADLAASMELIGRPTDPRVQETIAAGIKVVREAGKAAGTLSVDQSLARKYLALGAQFVAVGVDTTLLARAAKELANAFKGTNAATS